MSNIVRFQNGKAEYLISVNTPDYEGVDSIVNPDISAVADIPLKYWKRDGNNVIEMTVEEKQVIDDAELLERKKNAESFDISLKDLVEVLVVVGNTQWSQGKTITKAQIISLLKDKII